MISAFNATLSGMNAASDQLGVAASNIANALSTGETPGDAYHAQEAVQTSKYGSPYIIVKDKAEPTVELYAPGHSAADGDGFVGYPNVNLAEEITNLFQAEAAYLANALMFKTIDEMNDTLYEMFA